MAAARARRPVSSARSAGEIGLKHRRVRGWVPDGRGAVSGNALQRGGVVGAAAVDGAELVDAERMEAWGEPKSAVCSAAV